MSFAYGAYVKSNEAYNQTLNDIANILSFYECPDFCKGRCCKISKISFGKDEYDKMLTCEDEKIRTEIVNHTIKVRNIKARLLSQGIPKKIAARAEKENKENSFEFDSIVCPLLDNGKCKIHDLSPRVCKYYPFRFDNLLITGNVRIMLCFLGEEVYFDYFLMYSDIYAKKYNRQSEEIIINDLVHFKRSLEQAKEFQDFLLNTEEGDEILKETPGMDKAFLRLNLFFRYKSQISGDILQQKRDVMRDFLQDIEFIGEKVKFNQDNYRDFITKINKYAEPSIYEDFYKDAYIIDNSDLKKAKY
ncbi:MAG: hypothetical protein RBQ97_06490 [Acholeplasma sp.]|nr:hypothetical protein [Acholeplasma sp.]